MKACVLFYSTLLLACATTVSAQTERTVGFRGGPKVSVVVPMGYSFETRENSDGSIAIKMENPVWGIVMNAIVAQEPDPNVTQRAWQESKLVQFVAEAMTISKEDDYGFRTLPADSGTGVYCVFTAQGATRPAPGELPSGGNYLTGGLKAWPGCVVVFQIVSPDRTSPEYQEAFQVFTSSFTKF